MRTDFEFELRRIEPKPPWLLGASALALAVCATWSLLAWREWTVAQDSALDRELRQRRAVEQSRLLADRAASEAATQREAVEAFSALRRRIPAQLGQIERCHPAGAQVQSLGVDAIRGKSTIELRVRSEFQLEAWLGCLRSASGSRVEWRAIELRRIQPNGGDSDRMLVVAEGVRAQP